MQALTTVAPGVHESIKALAEEPNTDVDLRFASTPKPLEGAATLVFPNDQEAGVADAAVFPNGLD